MTASVIRKATDIDHERIEAAAERFVKRHNVDISIQLVYGDKPTVSDALENEIGSDDHLRKLWMQCWRRAVGEKRADGIVSGYIIFYV